MEKFGKGKDDDFEDVDFKIDDLKEELAGERKDQYKIRQTIKVKLVIAEICKSDTQKAIRKMLSPVLTKLDHQQQFGMFHSALVVGPWYLEWNNSSLCIPRKCYSSAAMLAADLDFQTPNNKFDLNKTIQLISEVIIDWNVNKEYTQRKNNCQGKHSLTSTVLYVLKLTPLFFLNINTQQKISSMRCVRNWG